MTSASTPITKPRRVRTGCLTCRERHLKCDEALPNCINCRKGNRPCKRGIRLNFLDTQVHVPPYVPRSCSWAVKFQDESRHIASEYRGGLQRYTPKTAKTAMTTPQTPRVPLLSPAMLASPIKYARAMSSPSSMAKSYPDSRLSSPNQVQIGWTDSEDSSHYVLDASAAYSHYLSWPYETPHFNRPQPPRRQVQMPTPGTAHPYDFKHAEGDPEGDEDDATVPLTSKPATGEREFLRTADEVRYMQVFVEEVAAWMDSFSRDKHFSHSIPYRALKSPMLLNSLLACGVRHLSMRDPDKLPTAQFYYNTATTQLLRNLGNPERDTTECTAAAVILKVCELMSRKTSRRMNHVSSARALIIRDCGWDAGSTGVGGACFWLNIYLEVLGSLESDCALSWPPDKWGLDTSWVVDEDDGGEDENKEENGSQNKEDGAEELWVQRMVYILAKVADFQAFVSLFVGNGLSGEKMRLEYRLPEWRKLKQLCDRWNDTCPRTMHPLGYLDRGHTTVTSLFPKVWLPKPEAVLGRLLYHTAQCILTQTNPMEQTMVSEEMKQLQIHHAHEVCGIVAHTREDSALTFLTVQSLLTASRVLVDDGERAEVLQMLRGMHADSGWFSDDVERDLKTTWSWRTDDERHREQVYPDARPPYQGWYEPPSSSMYTFS